MTARKPAKPAKSAKAKVSKPARAKSPPPKLKPAKLQPAKLKAAELKAAKLKPARTKPAKAPPAEAKAAKSKSKPIAPAKKAPVKATAPKKPVLKSVPAGNGAASKSASKPSKAPAKPTVNLKSIPMVEEIVTYLEMRAKPERPPVATPLGRIALMRADNCSVSFYRYLFKEVGEQWWWASRRRLTDEQLAAIIQDPKVEIYVLYVAGVPAGYFELDRRVGDEVELAFFGLMPDFIGKGYGPWLLQTSIQTAFTQPISRYWVHTCDFDHPKALALYQKLGFSIYKREIERDHDPRLLGILPRHLTHPKVPTLD